MTTINDMVSKDNMLMINGGKATNKKVVKKPAKKPAKKAKK